MPTTIRGTEYLQVSELADEVQVTRQTIWRWRRLGHIPQGNRFRGGKILFSPAEVQAVREYSQRVEPIYERADSDQGSLFEEDV